MTSYKKFISIFFLAIFVMFGLIISRPAQAQFADVIGGPAQIIQTIWQKIEKVYDTVQGIVGAEITNRTVGMFLDSLAYDVATELASGGQGGKPLFRTVSIEKSIQNAGNQALGEFLGELTEKGFDDLGINLCDPSIDLKLTLTLGILDEANPPKPKCDWTKLKKNWEQFDEKIQGDIIKFQLNPRQSGQSSVKGFWDYITSPTESDLGIAFRLNQKLIEEQTVKNKLLAIDAIECQGYIDKKTPISNEVITHCSQFKGMGENLFTSAAEIEAKRQQERSQIASQTKLSDILKDAANKFVNTYTSKLMKNWIKKGMWSLFGEDPYANYRDTLLDRLRGGADIRQPRGVDIFKDIKKVSLETIDDYDFINDFAICPPQFRSPDNCIMNPSFLQAINNKLTVQQAIDQRIIDGSTPFVHPDDRANHTVDNCYRDGLCYANLVKLRKANIIPVGWELAALRQAASLQQVIDCFEESDKCEFSRSSEYAVGGNDHNPFYHLVDPDWVLKAPAVRCDAYGFSPILESPESSNRQKYCADPAICLRQDADGNCIDDQYNYCTRSENTWNFNGQACDNGEVYAGCLTFSSKEAGTSSYIQDTLDYCTANQAGCRRYSQDIDGAGNWVLEDIAVDNNDLFLNKQAVDCSEDYAGCSEYIVFSKDAGVNLVPNGSFEDWNNDGYPDGWVDSAGNPSDGVDDPDGTINGLGISVDYDGNRLATGYAAPPNYPTTQIVKTRVLLEPNTAYVFSADTGQYNNGDRFRGRIILTMCDNATGCTQNVTPADSVDNVGTCYFNLGSHPNNVDLFSFNYTDEMVRSSCSFTTNEYVDYAMLEVVGMPPVPANGTAGRAAVWFDNIKIEAVSSVSKQASAYSDYGKGSKIYMNANTFMCSEDEVGCQGYIPANGDPMIPAVIVQGDLCPAECVGYDTFTEQPNIFDQIEGDNLVEYYNFIANTARQCPDQEVGCEEFTNLDIVAQGGEGREYFTYLRQCVTPNLGETYYTWEGTEVAGYQIKTWNALPSNLSDAPCTNMAPEGVNCLDVPFIDDGISQANEVAACGAETADWKDNPEFDPNCREFFDIDGDVFYRFQDRIIFATDNCHDYRRTATDQIYKAVPEDSISCSAVNNGCRSYYGNNANNIRDVILDNFEQGNYSPWTAISGTLDLSNESLDNNGHSLRMETGADISRDIAGLGLQNKKEYTASWWMKADASLSDLTIRLVGLDLNANTFDVYLVDPNVDSNFRNIEAGRWHYYTSSVYFDAPNVNMDLVFTAELMMFTNSSLDGQGLYIDNFRIREVENSFNVVRNSWNTPLSCNNPYEGYHLGCQAYTDLNGRNFNLKSFDHLCRENAIGCMPAIRTQNSSNPLAETFNAGDYSQITVPEDEKVYLVPDPNNYCPQEDKGCTQLGLPDRLNPNKFSTVYKINNPDKYGVIMCDAEGLNCSEYNTAKGIYYLKDPGNNTCTYQQDVAIDGSKLSGWFKTSSLRDEIPLGCADDDGNPYDVNGLYDVSEIILPRDYCSVSATNPIQLFYYTQDDCEGKGGYWNNYQLAAQCPASEDLCTAFKDPADPIGCDPKGRNIDFVDYQGFCWNGAVITAEDNQTDCENNSNTWIFPSRDGYCNSNVYNNQEDCEDAGWRWTPYCQEYYYYDDENIDETSCNGLVDRDEGCVLFYDANNWNGKHSQVITLYDTDETYENIEVDDRAYSPVSCNPSFDPNCKLSSNRLIQVDKDRQCAEWLACKSSTATYDEDSKSYKIVCDDLDTCLEFQYDPDSNTTKCKKWGSYDEEIEALTIEKYQSRATGIRDHIAWSDKEYTGYSIPNLLPVKYLNVYSFGDGANQMSRLVYDVVDRIDADGAYNSQCIGRDLAGNRFAVDGTPCSTDEINLEGDYVFRGECQDSVCWVSPRVNNSASTSTYAIEARAYAVADAPFPAAIEEDGINRLSQYNKANICIASDNSCELDFQKVTYGGSQEIFYYPAEAQSGSISRGVCVSGITIEKLPDGRTVSKECPTGQNWECDSFDNNGNRRGDGSCAVITEQILFKNWPGICLEYDNRTTLVKDNKNSYYCNQWYPAQKIQGTASLYDNYRAAGYYDAAGRDALFCTVAEPYVTTKDRYYCGYFSAGHDCNVLLKVPAGSKINFDATQRWPELLDIGSWMEELPASSARVSTLTVMPGGTRQISGTNFLDESSIGNSGAKFSRFDHFNNVLSETFNFMEIIDQMFDAPAGIERFYWDVDVAATGASNSSAFVKLENDTYYRSGGNCRNCPSWNGTCPSNYHLVYERCTMGGNCGWHRWRNAVTYCNPFSTSYYVSRASTEEVEQTYVGSCTGNCKFTDISIPEANHGRGCLQNAGIAPYYSNILNTYGSPGNFSWLTSKLICDAARDPDECGFVACIENLSVNQSTNHSCNDYSECLKYIIAENGALAVSQTLYGETAKCFGDGYYDHDLNSATALISAAAPIPDHVGPPPMYDPSDTATYNNCLNLNRESFATQEELTAFCSSCRLDDLPFFNYNTVSSGTDCDTNPITCYQQCRILTQLDSEGLVSAVRTDIWWRSVQRSSQGNEGRISQGYPWISWYAIESGYTSSTHPDATDDEVFYGEIAGLSAQGEYPTNFSHFGAGLDVFDPDFILSTRVPYYRVSPNNITAGTFFSYFNPANITLDGAMNQAHLQMQELFYRAYNWEWDFASTTYKTINPEPNFLLAGGNNNNPYAGPEYRPRILAACGDSLCNITDSNGNILDVETGITVNNKITGNLIGLEGSLFVSVKFFYHAHPDHMPVTDVGANWGDESGAIFSSSPGKYKNSLPIDYCDPNRDAPGDTYPITINREPQKLGFSGTDGACLEGYKIFYHNYLYDETHAHDCNGGFGALGTPPRPVVPNASCYQPSIQVIDNWGWPQVETFNGWIIVHDD